MPGTDNLNPPGHRVGGPRGKKILRLPDNTAFDLGGLDEGEAAQIMRRAASDVMDLRIDAARSQMDIDILDAVLDTSIARTEEGKRIGARVTISAEVEGRAGNTRATVSTTEDTKPDNTLAIAGIVAAVVVIAILATGN
ncbi:MAG: hypothetical protein OXD36_16030 [Rhodobacter sp.]|nr:hypothetical protein [Rhodobacter sp.]